MGLGGVRGCGPGLDRFCLMTMRPPVEPSQAPCPLTHSHTSRLRPSKERGQPKAWSPRQIVRPEGSVPPQVPSHLRPFTVPSALLGVKPGPCLRNLLFLVVVVLFFLAVVAAGAAAASSSAAAAVVAVAAAFATAGGSASPVALGLVVRLLRWLLLQEQVADSHHPTRRRGRASPAADLRRRGGGRHCRRRRGAPFSLSRRRNRRLLHPRGKGGGRGRGRGVRAPLYRDFGRAGADTALRAAAAAATASVTSTAAAAAASPALTSSRDTKGGELGDGRETRREGTSRRRRGGARRSANAVPGKAEQASGRRSEPAVASAGETESERGPQAGALGGRAPGRLVFSALLPPHTQPCSPPSFLPGF